MNGLRTYPGGKQYGTFDYPFLNTRSYFCSLRFLRSHPIHLSKDEFIYERCPIDMIFHALLRGKNEYLSNILYVHNFLSTSTLLTMDFYAKVTVGGWSMAQQVIYHKMTHTHTSFSVEFMYYSSKHLRHRTGSRSINRLSYPSLFLKASGKLGKFWFVFGTQCSEKLWVDVRNG